jgi:hypothetical protein
MQKYAIAIIRHVIGGLGFAGAATQTDVTQLVSAIFGVLAIVWSIMDKAAADRAAKMDK